MAFASGKVGRDVQPSVTFVSCGAQRTQSKLCGPASRPRERVDATRSRSRRMARGAHHDLLYGRGANLNSTTSETGRFSRRAMRHPARGTIAAAADVCCAAQRRAWQFLATHQPPHHPPLCFHLLLATPPRPPAAVRQGPTRDAPATARPPVLPAGALLHDWLLSTAV